jgi:hypothetical protein
MGQLRETRATLGFYGDDLDPDEITAHLGVRPTVGVRRGEPWLTSLGATKTAPTGSWRLHASDQQPGDLNAQIEYLLGVVSSDRVTWQVITSKYRAVLFCGLFLEEWNGGLVLPPATLAAAGSRGLLLDLDIYGPEGSD